MMHADSDKTSDQNFALVISQPALGAWYAGVTGFTDCTYTITLTLNTRASSPRYPLCIHFSQSRALLARAPTTVRAELAPLSASAPLATAAPTARPCSPLSPTVRCVYTSLSSWRCIIGFIGRQRLLCL